MNLQVKGISTQSRTDKIITFRMIKVFKQINIFSSSSYYAAYFYSDQLLTVENSHVFL